MIKVFDVNSKEWNRYLGMLPKEKRDIYFTREYYEIQEKSGYGKARLCVFSKDDKILFYPFLVNEIKEHIGEIYYDIETAYGYGGPICNVEDREFINEFEIEFDKYCNENKIVAEFIRFHPVINNYNIFNNRIKVIFSRETVSLDLQDDIDKIWSEQITSKNRNVIRKAEKNNLQFEICNNISEFREVYNKTMVKVDAEKFYYFTDDYFKNIKKLGCVNFNIKLTDTIIASAIFLMYGEYFHYHLSGSLKEYLKFSPNNLLLWKAILYAKENNYKVMHFGGGISEDEKDSLLKFKSSFSKERKRFYIGKRIHNEKVYNKLIDNWEKSTGKKSKLFLQYKY